MRRIFLLVPSPHPTGPVKGAIALANSLADRREVTLVTLKPGPGADAPIDARVRTASLAAAGSVAARVRAYRALLRAAGGRRAVASISLCFSADLVNRFCRAEAVTCASVRGNLPGNYRLDYGLPGLALAQLHLRMLAGFDHVTAMTRAMAAQIARHAGCRPEVIANFVDEAPLEPFRAPAPAGPPRFVFVGTLSERKQPLRVLDALRALRAGGLDARLDVVGGGPLRDRVAALAAGPGLAGAVTVHGHVGVPQAVVAQAHALVLPSLAEGISRATLEALHLGLPCVLRDADGNGELIDARSNGILFRDDAALPEAMRAVLRLVPAAGPRPSLLPEDCRQAEAGARYLALVERADGAPGTP